MNKLSIILYVVSDKSKILNVTSLQLTLNCWRDSKILSFVIKSLLSEMHIDDSFIYPCSIPKWYIEIIIENANKFGLSQLHQLRGRVGRGDKDSSCILMFKSNLSENAKKRINILKNSNDGFEISEEDMKIRGFGDILGFKQSGIKNFKLADPIHNSDLFILAEKEIKRIEKDKEDISKFKPLIKLYDRADIINDIA